jgi:hypothetical protein
MLGFFRLLAQKCQEFIFLINLLQGATSVKLSDGTMIGSQKEMRKFLAVQGFNVKKLITVSRFYYF